MRTVGKEIPIKKPNTTPTAVDTISLILTFGFLRNPLQVKMQLHRVLSHNIKYVAVKQSKMLS